MPHRPPCVGILGGGQLGRMLVLSANQHSIPVTILDSPNAPAKQVSMQKNHVDGSFSDPASVRELADNCDVITAEIEHVDTYALEEVEKSTEGKVKIEPDWRSIRIIQDKLTQKEHLAKVGIPQAEHLALHKKGREEGAEIELETVGEKLGYPFMLKCRTLAYDGRGNYAVKSKEDIPQALEALKGRPLYAEKWVDHRMELAVMVVKTASDIYSYPTVETVQEDSICKLVYAPARNVPLAVNQAAQKLAREAVATFTGKGVFGVEMFLLNDGKSLCICEIASRVHNSGHYTIEACELSQFDAHLRAILDLPIAQESLEMQVPAAIMLNVLGGKAPENHHRLEALALSIPGARVHPYGKGDGRPGRKMGHITVTGRTMNEAERRIKPLLEFDIDNPSPAITCATPAPTRAGDPNEPTHLKHPAPSAVAVIMGSDSDLKTLVPGLHLLKDYFSIIPEVEITSAHRTPLYMTQYCQAAERRGIKVIIAAAGGAAHLPGMAAANTTLPVIGVPVKGSSLDGVDSLHSIVQMPRGVPVATVGINNSVNAALLAMRILGTQNAEISTALQQYASIARDENLDVKGPKLREAGWEAYWENMQHRRHS